MGRAVVALVAWTFLVWTTRIANIWRDADLDTGDKLGPTALALGFTALAVAVLVAAKRAGRKGFARSVELLAGWTAFVWILRGTGMLFGDWSAGFKVVHTVLAVVSIALAYLAFRQVDRPAGVSPTSVGSG